MEGPSTWADRLRARGGRSLGPVLTLVTGATAAQVVVLLARPALTRLYSPEAFGLLGVFVAGAYLLATLATLRYDDAVAVPEADRDGAGLLALALVGTAAMALLALPAVPARAWIADALDAPTLAPLVPLIPVAAALLGAGAASQSWLARRERFRPLSVAAVGQSVLVVGVQLALVGRGVVGLVAGTLAGAAVFAAVQVTASGQSGAVRLAREARLGALAREFRRFPAFGLPASAMNQVALRLPPLVLVAAFDATVVGFFTVAVASVAASVGVVTAAVGQVFYVRAAEGHREGRLGALVEAVHARLVAFVAFPVLAVALVGPDLFAVVFGGVWREAGVYAQLLAPWLLLSAIAPPLTRVFDATGRQREEMLTGVVTAVCVGLALVVGARLGDARPALTVLGVGGVVARLVQIGWIFRIAGASVAHGARDLLGGVLRAALWLAPAGVALVLGSVWTAFGLAAFAGAGYAWAVLRPLVAGRPVPSAAPPPSP